MNHSLITTKVLPQFFVTMLVSAVGAAIGMLFIPPTLAFAVGIGAFVMLIAALVFRSIRGKSTSYGIRLSMSFVHIFTFLAGVSISPSIKFYLSEIGALWVAAGFGITALLFGSLAAYSYFTKKDFSFLGGILFFSLLTLVIVGIASLFIQSTMLELGLAAAGIIVFSGYMLYDVSRMKHQTFSEQDVPMAVLDLYLNFTNILLDVLRIIYYIIKER